MNISAKLTDERVLDVRCDEHSLIVDLMDEALQKPTDEKHLKRVKQKVLRLARRFPLYA